MPETEQITLLIPKMRLIAEQFFDRVTNILSWRVTGEYSSFKRAGRQRGKFKSAANFNA